jgi:hypothetical protein
MLILQHYGRGPNYRFLIATICLTIHAVQLVLIWLAANEDARHRAHFRSSFFSFRPPPTPLQHN